MATYNIPNTSMYSNFGQQPVQFPYGNNNMLLNNTPYDNYMGNNNRVGVNNNQNQFLKCRPVSSKEQARAYQIDLDGSLWVFTDLGNGKIYTKQVNNDGTATFNTYVFTQDQSPYDNNSNEYVTREEFNKVVQTLMAAMQAGNPQGPVPTPANNDKTTTMDF